MSIHNICFHGDVSKISVLWLKKKSAVSGAMFPQIMLILTHLRPVKSSTTTL